MSPDKPTNDPPAWSLGDSNQRESPIRTALWILIPLAVGLAIVLGIMAP